MDGTYSRLNGVVTASVTGHQLIVGQAVRMGYANAAPEVLIVDSVPDANHFTATSSGSNKSGNVRIYAEGARYYMFDKDGNRIDGVVSWQVKGN